MSKAFASTYGRAPLPQWERGGRGNCPLPHWRWATALGLLLLASLLQADTVRLRNGKNVTGTVGAEGDKLHITMGGESRWWTDAAKLSADGAERSLIVARIELIEALAHEKPKEE